ncbi:hypothetical protein BD324DRAFT_606879 [Kockovaella imperatae]|uniref:Uncharacterized protein n=1 Tax=Kockovaella imperatae TaxID=4999 RepID=A0A1Y1UNF4_9TREE|nr:hypothetical protein BD324DRAFT_606879 [Kockovaella imperatae]ORX39539.1 hypothetical protein BD324DRAFT_606879 [Kockovaella imperatae]
MTLTDSIRILTPSPILGYGYPEQDLWRGVTEYHADAIIVDGGSTDGGPDDLALNHTVVSREMYERDLSPMIDAVYHHGVKLLISSAGGAGPKAHVDFIIEIITQLVMEKQYSLKVAAIYSDVSKETVLRKLKLGQIEPCGDIPQLVEEKIHISDQIVCQVGYEPFLKALQSEPDIIVGGRAYDPAPFIAYTLHRLGHEARPTAWHMGKIMECGGICAIPKGKVILATVRRDAFELLPMNPDTRCTELSVAAHTLYEKTRPDLLAGPGGLLDIRAATYTQISDRAVRVSGAKIVEKPVALKLEGARQVGFKTVFLGGIRDPILISGIESFTVKTWENTADMFPVLRSEPDTHKLLWKFYGKNAVMAHLEPNVNASIHEIGLYGEVMAPSQRLSNAIANCARVGVLHGAYPGQVATAGNFASPGTPLELSAGACCEFTVYHLMQVEDPSDFPIEERVIGGPHRSISPTRTPVKIVNGTTNGTACGWVKTEEKPVIESLIDLARVVRSKNSGPYEITFDVMFSSYKDYEYVKDLDILNTKFVKRAWQCTEDDILALMWFKPALAWKCTIRRAWDQGSFGERDTFGTAQHGPLMSLRLDGGR